jgi:DNA invertase Pin-like site-specific DNA recombinase
MFFNILATFAEFEVDLLRLRTREGMAVARQGQAAWQAAQAHPQAASRDSPV